MFEDCSMLRSDQTATECPGWLVGQAAPHRPLFRQLHNEAKSCRRLCDTPSARQEAHLMFPSDSCTYILMTRFYFLNRSNIILNISQYTASGCSTPSLHCPCRDLLFTRRRVELALPRKCCTVSIYQHLMERRKTNLQIFLDLIM